MRCSFESSLHNISVLQNSMCEMLITRHMNFYVLLQGNMTGNMAEKSSFPSTTSIATKKATACKWEPDFNYSLALSCC